MNGSSAINYPITNEHLIGKFHVDKLSVNNLNNHDDIIIPQTSSIHDESGCTSRFQVIHVDRNFGRGRWKVNDYEPPESTLISTIPPVNTIENEQINISNNSILLNISATTIPNISATMPTVITGDSNATAASVAAATAAAFQQRMTLNSTPTVIPTANVPPPAGLMHAYPPAALANQSYLLPNHHQFGYYPFYPPPYSPYAVSWAAAAALAASNHYLPPHANLNDPIRHIDTISDINSENTVISSNTFPNPTTDHLQNAQLAAIVSFLYGAPHSHSPFVQQASSSTSPYATMPSYHSIAPHPTIISSNQLPQTLPFSQYITNNNTNDIQQTHQPPLLTSPKHDATKNLIQQTTTQKTKPLVTTTVNGINNDPSKTTYINDLISSSPAITTSHPLPSSLISPINAPTTSLSDIWTYRTTSSPLSLTQTAQTAVAAMGLLNNENNQNTEIANEILKELTTPTKQNNTTDIDNKISAAMDLVKMHLLSAVREEVTELRQQIQILNEKVNSVEHENAFLRQHVPSEIYAQYIPTFIGLSCSNDSINSTNTIVPSIPLLSSSQSVPITSLSSIPSSLAQQPTLLTTNLQPSLSTTNLPLT